MSHFTLLTVIALLALVRNGLTILDCDEPPVQSNAFFDLVELQSLAVKYPDVIQTPVKFSSQNASSACANQICCEDHISCCYNDTVRKRHICGCKSKTDKDCTLGPPLAYIRSNRCEDLQSAEIDHCIRKRKDGETGEGSLVTSIGPLTRIDADSALVAIGNLKILGPATEEAHQVVESNLVVRNVNALNDFLVPAKLARLMSTEELYILAQEVMARHEKGLPYGRQQMGLENVKR